MEEIEKKGMEINLEKSKTMVISRTKKKHKNSTLEQLSMYKVPRCQQEF